MLVKVCGIKYQDNLDDLCQSTDLDMVGFNFYRPSARFVASPLSLPNSCNALSVGVFVNPSRDYVLKQWENFKLQYFQFHGNESAEFCEPFKTKGKIIKVISVSKPEDLASLSEYAFVDYFLFDTKTKHYGGSGRKFNWKFLETYSLDIPFLLAGGISPADLPQILDIGHPQFAGIDINSQFELEAGRKDIQMIKTFIQSIKASL